MSSPYVSLLGSSGGGNVDPPGPLPSEYASALRITQLAGTSLSALRIVYSDGTHVRPLDNTDLSNVPRLLGMSLTAGLLDEEIVVQRQGMLFDLSWTWVPGFLWLGTAGQLTQIPPSSGACIIVAEALSATQILLSPFDPTYQE